MRYIFPFEIAVWVGALLAAGVGYRWLGGPVVTVAVTLFLMQNALLAYNWIKLGADLERQSDTATTVASREMIYRFSSRSNVVHIIADGFQSDVFAELIAEGETGKYLKAGLDGFTFFREHMGVFPYTHMTLPASPSAISSAKTSD